MRPEAVLLILIFAALIVILSSLYQRYRYLLLFHKERMAALEKGVPVPGGQTFVPWSPRVYLLRGLLWSFGGVAVIVSLLGIAASSHRPEPADAVMWRARNISQNLNISMEEARQIAEKDRDRRQTGMPFSVALLGLIPAGVGLAYLVFYQTGKGQPVQDGLTRS